MSCEYKKKVLNLIDLNQFWCDFDKKKQYKLDLLVRKQFKLDLTIWSNI